MNLERIIAIVGPTAVGKTGCALELAKRLRGEIISADSMAVYRGFDIGTAKPTAVEQSLDRFHLIDVADAHDEFNVSKFVSLATQSISQIRNRNCVPLLVGGTGLYVKSLLEGYGLTNTPAKPEIRTRLRKVAETEGVNALFEKLSEVDPLSAARIHPNDVVRMVRALEVFELTGIPISRQQIADKQTAIRLPSTRFGLMVPRDELNLRINDRVDRMVKFGIVDEVAHLLEQGYDNTCAPMRSLGYAEILQMLRGELTLAEAVDLIKSNTRKYAKRQMTWFKADSNVQWIDVSDRSIVNIADEIIRKLSDPISIVV